MSMKPHRLVLLTAVWIACSGTAYAHAVRHAVSGQGATTVRWHYHDGRPLVSSSVTVYAPGQPDIPFQEGSTDLKGGFAFVPHTNGRWRVTVNDGAGHAADVYVEVDQAGQASDVSASGAPVSLDRLLVGVSVLFGGFGLWSLFAARKRARTG